MYRRACWFAAHERPYTSNTDRITKRGDRQELGRLILTMNHRNRFEYIVHVAYPVTMLLSPVYSSHRVAAVKSYFIRDRPVCSIAKKAW